MNAIHLRPYQEEAIAKARKAVANGARSVCLVCPTGGGKCLGRDVSVMLANGRAVAVQDVRVGDVLMGPGGEPRHVLSVTQGRGPMFQITPIKGRPWTCNWCHILTLVHTETGEIVDIPLDEYLQKSAYWKHCHKLFRSPVSFSHEEDGEQKFSPYFMGVLLGDGSMRETGMVSVCKPDLEIEQAFAEEAAAHGMVFRADRTRPSAPNYFALCGRRPRHPWREYLDDYGLLGAGAADKFIPDVYKYASEESRLQVLAGLLDTDGYLGRGCFDFISASERLAEDVAFVARSLGFSAVARSCQKGYPGFVGTYYRVSISGDTDQIPTRIPRKQALPRRQKKDVTRTGFTVQPIGDGDYFGFELDGDGRFLLGDFTVTHNTTIAAGLIAGALERGSRVLFLAHRVELVEQAAATFERFGLRVGVISASSGRSADPTAPVQVASLDTLIARDLRPAADVVIFDEFQHSASDTYSALVLAYRAGGAIIIGLTATPERGDGRGLGTIADRLLVVAKIKDLTAHGYLVPCEVIAPPGELRPGQIAQRPVDAYLQHARGRSTLVYSPTIALAEVHAGEFRAAGIDAQVITGDTPADERRAALEAFKAGRLPILCSVAVLTEGTDLPVASAAIVARRVGTPGLLLQIAGRVLRPHPSKTNALLIDLCGVSHVHGKPDDERVYSLEGRGITRVGEAPGNFCRCCGAPAVPGEQCPECGIEAREPKPLKVTGDPLVKFARKRQESNDQRAETLARWKKTGIEKGYKPSWALVRYRAVYNEWPPRPVQEAAEKLVVAGLEGMAA